MKPLLPSGSRIAVVAPASRFDPERLEQGMSVLRAWGYELVLPDGLLAPVRSLAASDAVRRDHLSWALSASDIDAVWAVRGGYGVTRLLDSLDWSTFRPRPVVGFSDLTPLLDQLAQRGFPAVHGPVVHSIPSTDASSLDALRSLLQSGTQPSLTGAIWKEGTATGPIVGGNLCLMAATCGTSAQIDTTDAIVLLEEIGEPAYRVDRMLQQLASSGQLDAAAGVALGQFTGCDAPDGQGWDVNDVLRDHLMGLGVPVVADLPIGHGPCNHPFVVRSTATLQDGVLTLASGGPAA